MTTLPQTTLRRRLQTSGRFLSGMVVPNIGAFIAWGLMTACFIPAGWFPNERLARLVEPTLTYLLPFLIGTTGGRMIHGVRGGVIGAVATMGAIVGADVPMFLGAMFVGPASAWLLRRIDEWTLRHSRAGFEMLVNNFSLGIAGMACALVAYSGVGPLMSAVSSGLAAGVQVAVAHHLLPLAHLLIEPGKVLFLNNAINHGILNPIGITESNLHGRSVLFMLESNPGPGLGVLLACWWLGRGEVRQSAPGAAVVHFFGGIHEIYFPYILMAPRLLLAPIAGGMCGTLVFSALGAGLIAVPSPGSIFAYLAMAPRGALWPVLTGVTVSAAVSFAVAAMLLKFSRSPDTASSLEEAGLRSRQWKNPVVVEPAGRRAVQKIVFACDAGMGSSAMGAAMLRKRFRAANIDVTVTNCAISDLPPDCDVVLTHENLTERARLKLPRAEHISLRDFLKSPVYDQLVERLAHKS